MHGIEFALIVFTGLVGGFPQWLIQGRIYRLQRRPQLLDRLKAVVGCVRVGQFRQFHRSDRFDLNFAQSGDGVNLPGPEALMPPVAQCHRFATLPDRVEKDLLHQEHVV